MMNKTAIETHVEEATVQAGGLLRSKYGLWALGGISFIESALVVPIITDPFLVAYILADKKSVYKGVIVTLIGSILGGVFAYAIAFLFYEFIAERYLVGVVGEQFYVIVDRLKEGTFIISLLGAITPIPYTLVAMGAGFVKGNFFLFLLASVLGRGGRYAIVGAITYMFGEQALVMVRRQVLLITLVCVTGAAFVLFFK